MVGVPYTTLMETLFHYQDIWFHLGFKLCQLNNHQIQSATKRKVKDVAIPSEYSTGVDCSH